LLDLLRATRELAVARTRLASWQARNHFGDSAPRGLPQHGLDPVQARLVERIAFAVPRVANRLPWRTDCLVQAFAGQRWLAGHDIETRLVLGARRGGPSGFEAHAWLMAGDRVVTGGDISTYVPFGTKQP